MAHRAARGKKNTFFASQDCHPQTLAVLRTRIQGPGIPGERQEWQGDHALFSWRHFWTAETKRRGIKGPEVIERYPYLAGGKPGNLPGMDDLEALVEDAVVVSTADAFHHGIGYGDSPDEAQAPDQAGLKLARQTLEEGIALLEKGDYWEYNQHCVRAKSDARDAGQVFRYLRGPMNGQILDLTYTDASELYHQPAPTWVSGALFEWMAALHQVSVAEIARMTTANAEKLFKLGTYAGEF